jgi:hypothetical protein
MTKDSEKKEIATIYYNSIKKKILILPNEMKIFP